jgi:hypothetical protein
MIIIVRAGTFVKGNVLGRWYLTDSARLTSLRLSGYKIKQF